MNLFNALVLFLGMMLNVYRHDLSTACLCLSGFAGWYLLYLKEKDVKNVEE